MRDPYGRSVSDAPDSMLFVGIWISVGAMGMFLLMQEDSDTKHLAG